MRIKDLIKSLIHFGQAKDGGTAHAKPDIPVEPVEPIPVPPPVNPPVKDK